MLCEKCGNIYLDIHPTCPFCLGQADIDLTEDEISMKWGIEKDLAKDIIASGNEKYLCDNMVISSSGDIFFGDDEEDLREVMFESLVEGDIQLDEIEEVFVGGAKHLFVFDIQFKPQE